jgi:molybdopterin molybdotransferase
MSGLFSGYTMLQTDEFCDRPGLLTIDVALPLALGVVSEVKETETVSLRDAVGRIAAKDITSTLPLPPFDQSAVDGYGLHLDDIHTGALGPFQVAGKLAAGGQGAPRISAGETVRLLTGAAIPRGIGAVVMEEKITLSQNAISLSQAVELGLNIRHRGEDVGQGSVIVEAGTLIDARHVAILAASGVARLAVRRRLRVAVLSTGDELATAGTNLRKHQIYDSNGPMLFAMLASPAVHLRTLGRCPDHRGRLVLRLKRAAKSFDLLICSGGVSGSDADHIVAAVLEAKGQCRQVGLALKPGKPLALGRIGCMAVLALPGNSVAALVGALLFGRPMLAKLGGRVGVTPGAILAKTASAFSHRLGRTEFVPVRIAGHDSSGTPLLEKLGRGGSARLRPLAIADGLGRIPGDRDDLPSGVAIEFFPFRTAFAL